MADNTMSFDEYIECMHKPFVHPLLRIEMLNSDESVFSNFTCEPISGNITTTAVSGGIRRSCDIVLPNIDKQFIPNSNDINKPWLSTKFMVYTGIIDDFTKKTIFFPAGLYTLCNSDLEIISSYSSKTVNLKANDKFDILNNPVGYIYQIAIGSKVTSVISSILDICGDKKEPILEDLPDLVVSTLRFSATDTYASILKQLSDLYSRESFYNSSGQFVFQSYKSVFILNNVWKYSTDDLQYNGASRLYKNSEVVNDLVCIGGTVDTSTFMSESKNTDPSSDTRISKIGLKTLVIQDEKISSDALCQQRSDMELAKRMRMQELISLTSNPIYNFDVNSAITIVDDSIDLHEDKYCIQEFQLDLTSHSAMTIQAYKYNDTTAYEDLGLPS